MHGVEAAHAHARAFAGGLQFPALETPHTISILEAPFERAAPFIARDDRRVCHLAPPQAPADAHLEPQREFRGTVLNLEAALHFGAIPVGHALRDKEG